MDPEQASAPALNTNIWKQVSHPALEVFAKIENNINLPHRCPMSPLTAHVHTKPLSCRQPVLVSAL